MIQYLLLMESGGLVNVSHLERGLAGLKKYWGAGESLGHSPRCSHRR